MDHAIPTNAFALPITVVEDDIDAQGHVSNVTIVKWMSRAAWQHSQALGWGVEQYRQLGAWFVVRRHEIDYHASAVLGDALIAYTWPSGLAKATAERRHVILRAADQAPVAVGLNRWAYVDATTGRPLRIPDELRRTFDPAQFT